MFNLQGSEIIIILLLALVVLGPEKLPDAMRKAGKFYADIRKMSSGFQDEFRSAMDEPMREVRETANMLRDSADFTALADGERGEKPQSSGGPADVESMPTSVEIDDEDDDDDDEDIDPTVGAGEGLAAPAGQSPIDIRKPDAQKPPPPPPPFSGSNTLGPAVVDETVAEPVQDGSIPAPPAPFSGSTTLGLGISDASDANAAEPATEPVAESVVPPPPGSVDADTPAVAPQRATEPPSGAEDAPA